MRISLLIFFFFLLNKANADHHFSVGVQSGLNITFKNNGTDKLLLPYNLSGYVSYIQQNKKALGAITTFSFISSVNKYRITPTSSIADNKLKTRLNFAISLKQKKTLKIYSGIFVTLAVAQSATLSTRNDNLNIFSDVSLAEKYFKQESKKVNAGLLLAFVYSPIKFVKQKINFSCSLHQNFLTEYYSNFEISKTLPNINYSSSGINPLLTELNIGIGLNL